MRARRARASSIGPGGAGGTGGGGGAVSGRAWNDMRVPKNAPAASTNGKIVPSPAASHAGQPGADGHDPRRPVRVALPAAAQHPRREDAEAEAERAAEHDALVAADRAEQRGRDQRRGEEGQAEPSGARAQPDPAFEDAVHGQ